MKDYDYKSQYYISNTPWKRKLNIEEVKRFNNIRYSDAIVFHFDFTYSIFKVNQKTRGYTKKLFVSAINVCLRFYQIIKSIYPYNKVYVIIYVRNGFGLDINTLKLILDLIPNFAASDENCSCYFNGINSYKHIFYGSCNGTEKDIISNKQDWSVIDGNLVVKESKN